jgi:hypothetical protein
MDCGVYNPWFAAFAFLDSFLSDTDSMAALFYTIFSFSSIFTTARGGGGGGYYTGLENVIYLQTALSFQQVDGDGEIWSKMLGWEMVRGRLKICRPYRRSQGVEFGRGRGGRRRRAAKSRNWKRSLRGSAPLGAPTP